MLYKTTFKFVKSNKFGYFESDQIVLYIYTPQSPKKYCNIFNSIIMFTILILQSTNNTWCGSKKYNETQKLRTYQSGYHKDCLVAKKM